MLVDDDPFIRDVVSAALGARPNISVSSFASASDAIAAAQLVPPDIIVLDFNLPGTNGIDVLGDLKRVLSPLPPVIFLTAHGDADLIARLWAQGAAGVLAKPFDPATIAHEILRLGGPRVLPRETRLDAVAEKFRGGLATTLAEIDAEWQALQRAWHRPVAESLLDRVHKLAGSAGLFKLGRLGEAARAAETALLAQLDAEARGHAAGAAALSAAILSLQEAGRAGAKQGGAG